ncbi:mitochondrial potassium channel-like [Sabethes cyaneus]|uniref:mitochondrial potassium channel-like n=1 Tax=Sabethes cyaneus TaxID=53552 RepID=UPI00237D5E5F|nr:mitochondrial potassium channel-like [Sabethes cyaneus]
MITSKLVSGAHHWRTVKGSCNHYIIQNSWFSVQRNDQPPDNDKQRLEKYEYITLHQTDGSSSQHQSNKASEAGSNIALRRISLLDLAKSKLYEAQSFYDDFSGMSEVKVAQNKVIEIQNQLQLVQERRRHILLELTLIRKQLQDIHVDLQKAVRGEHRYVELIKEEFDVIAREKEKNQIFQIVDQEERELFSHLTSAVKTSHEKERTQANNVKYWSIIGSCVGALLGIIATSINYYYRNTQFESIKRTAGESVSRLAQVQDELTGFGSSLEYIRQYVELRKLEDDKERLKAARMLAEGQHHQRTSEGWGSYLKRNTVRVYRYFIPNTNKSK